MMILGSCYVNKKGPASWLIKVNKQKYIRIVPLRSFTFDVVDARVIEKEGKDSFKGTFELRVGE